MGHRLFSLGAIPAVLLALACSEPSAPTPVAPAMAAATSGSPVVGRVGPQTITLEELDDYMKQRLLMERTEEGKPALLYRLRVRFLQERLNRAAAEQVAAADDLTLDEYMERELDRQPISDEAIRAFYETNRDRLRVDPGLEELRPVIRDELESQRKNEIARTMVESIERELLIEPPRIAVEALGPSRGPDDAPVTIIEFGDYRCPHCRRVEQTVAKVLEQYPGDVRLVYRHSPSPQREHAHEAAKAAVCADAQGRFWPYHERLFASQDTLSPERMRELAGEVELDLAAFDACLVDPATAKRVALDETEASGLGLRSTPSFLVNGVLFEGARSFDYFDRLIRAELEETERS